jgi:hypothetical protein
VSAHEPRYSTRAGRSPSADRTYEASRGGGTVVGMRRVLLPLLGLAALLPAVSGAPAAATATCRSTQLAGRIGGSTGAAGTIMLAVVLRNTSGTTCTVRGYPALRLYRPHRYLPTTVHHGGLVPLNRPVRTITLHPRGQATVLVAYHDVPSGNQPCLASTSLLVFSAGRVDGVPVSVRATACGGRLLESPLIAGVIHAP